MAGVFDIELHDEIVEKDESDDDAIEIEEVSDLFYQNNVRCNHFKHVNPLFALLYG